VGGAGSRLGGVEGEGETGVGDHVDALVGQIKITDHGMVEQLAASAVEADVVATPAAAEVAAAGGQLPDQIVQVLVVRVTAGLGPQDRDTGVGRDLPAG
jgi:hypothetical protein